MSDLTAVPAALPAVGEDSERWLERYAGSLMPTYGRPQRVLVRGEGCWVWDADGRRYLDLLGGIATSTLGHAHPLLVSTVTAQLATLGHVSNFFATAPQVALAERLLAVLDAPAGSAVFFCNSGAEANEAAFKMARRTGRTRIVAAEGGFHGRTMGALALTHKPAIREPFAPLPGDVVHVPYGDVAALRAAVDESVAAVVLEPIQGEAGVVPAPEGYLAAAREATAAVGALLVLDEVQTGIGRTGAWFAHTRHGVVPDVVTVAKALGGGIPIGAAVALGERAAGLLDRRPARDDVRRQPGVGRGRAGRPACRRARRPARQRTRRRRRGCGRRSRRWATRSCARCAARDCCSASSCVRRSRRRWPRAPSTPASSSTPWRRTPLRLAPPLVLTAEQADSFTAALPGILDAAAGAASPTSKES